MSEKKCNCTKARYGLAHADTCPKYGLPVTWKDKIEADTRAVEKMGRKIG
jgi:hypothetical protein